MVTNPWTWVNPGERLPTGGASTGHGSGMGRGDHGESLGRGDHGESLGRGDHGESLGSGIEGIVRPFETDDVTPDAPAPPKPYLVIVGLKPQDEPEDADPLPGEDLSEAFISWGKSSQFQFERPAEEPVKDPTGEEIKPGDGGFNTQAPNTKPDEPEEDPNNATVLDEIWRVVEKVKVENPEDEEQWVEVERVVSIAFRNSTTGRNVVMRFDHSGANKTVQSGTSS